MYARIAHAVISYSKSLDTSNSPEHIPAIVVTPPDEAGEILERIQTRFRSTRFV